MFLWSIIREVYATDFGTMYNYLTNLMIMKTFNILNKVFKALHIIEVKWYNPLPSWIIVNTDDASNYSTGVLHAFEAELFGIITAIEFAII